MMNLKLLKSRNRIQIWETRRIIVGIAMNLPRCISLPPFRVSRWTSLSFGLGTLSSIAKGLTLVRDDKIVTDELALSEIFSNHYINIVEKTSDRKPTNLADTISSDDDRQIIKKIIKNYKDHLSMVAIKQQSDRLFEPFSLQKLGFYVWQLLKSIDCRTSIGADQIPPRLLSLAGDYLALPLN